MQTAIDLAAYLSQLKQTAGKMQESFGMLEQGYFTPLQDEQTKQLLHSYITSRAALLEIVDDCRRQFDYQPSDDPELFILGFSIALLLIDSARFMRNSFKDNPYTIRKLNEPEPHLNIPANTYQNISQSLTSPDNAIALIEAKQYFQEHTQSIQTFANTCPLASQLLRLIENKIDTLKISLTEFSKASLIVRRDQAVRAIKHKTLGRLLYKIQKIGSVMVSSLFVKNHTPCLPDMIASELKAQLNPGDVLVTRKEHAMTNYFLPGYWPHAALHLGTIDEIIKMGLREQPHFSKRWKMFDAMFENTQENAPHFVLESMKDGVRVRLLSTTFESDAVAVIRPNLSTPLITKSLERGMYHEGKPYDFDFDFTRSDRMVCTEVVYRSYQGIEGFEFDLTKRAGRLNLSAEDLLHLAYQRKQFHPITGYCKKHHKHVLSADELVNVLKNTLSIFN